MGYGKSTNGGVTWPWVELVEEAPSPISNAWRGIWANADGVWICDNNRGLIAKSTGFGAWQVFTNVEPTVTKFAICGEDFNTVHVACSNGKIVSTTDGGTIWSTYQFPSDDQWFYGIFKETNYWRPIFCGSSGMVLTNSFNLEDYSDTYDFRGATGIGELMAGTNQTTTHRTRWTLGIEPKVVYLIQAYGEYQKVRIHWEGETDYSPWTFYIYRAPAKEGPWTYLKPYEYTGPVGDFTIDDYDESVTYSVPYWYYITGAAIWDDPDDATPTGLPSHTPPNPPITFTVDDYPSDNGWKMFLSWSSVPGVTIYYIYRDLNSPSNHPDLWVYPEDLHQVRYIAGVSDITTCVDDFALTGYPIEYWVRSYDGITVSEPIVASGASIDNLAPPKVTGLSGYYDADNDYFYVEWEPVNDPTLGGYWFCPPEPPGGPSPLGILNKSLIDRAWYRWKCSPPPPEFNQASVQAVDRSGNEGEWSDVLYIPTSLANGDFEDGLDWWTPYGDGDSYQVSGDAHSGNHSAEITRYRDYPSIHFGLFQANIPCKSNTTYWLRAYIKTQSSRGFANASFGVWSADPDSNHHSNFGYVSGNTDWVRVYGKWTSRDYENNIEVKLYGNPDFVGSAKFDDVVLKEYIPPDGPNLYCSEESNPHGYNLWWTFDPKDFTLDYYKLKFRKYGQSWQTLYTGSDTSYFHEIAKPPAGSYYEYQVIAYCEELFYSNVRKVWGPLPDPVIAESNFDAVTGYNNGKRIVVDGNGRIHISWCSLDSVYYSYTDDGENFVTEAVGSGQFGTIDLYEGNPIISWIDAEAEESALYFSRLTDDGWEEPILLRSEELEKISGPSMNIVSNIAFFAWAEKEKGIGASWDVYTGTLDLTGSSLETTLIEQFTSETDVLSPSITESVTEVSLIYDRNGEILYREYDGSSWSEAQILSTPGVFASHPSISSYGVRISATWQEEIWLGIYNIYYASKLLECEWEEPVRISTSRNCEFPVIAGPVVAWAEEISDSIYTVYAQIPHEFGYSVHSFNLSGTSEGSNAYPNIVFT